MIAESVQKIQSDGVLDDVDRREPGAALTADESVVEEIANPLETLMSEIRSDASADPVQYLLRSNTSHDGE